MFHVAMAIVIARGAAITRREVSEMSMEAEDERSEILPAEGLGDPEDPEDQDREQDHRSAEGHRKDQEQDRERACPGSAGAGEQGGRECQRQSCSESDPS